jgi:AcrR family transcriptional regulator
VELGLESFTLAEVAAHVGVAESTVYNYVTGRDALWAEAAATVFARRAVEADAEAWTDYVDLMAERAATLARAHPGLRDYVLYGPYHPSSLPVFQAMIDAVRARLPGISEDLGFVLASRPFVLSLGYVDDPLFDPMGPWLRRALLTGLDQALADGQPPELGEPWNARIHLSE